MSPSTVEFERSLYIGIAVGSILYGLQIYMVFHSRFLLLNSKDECQGRSRRAAKLYVIYGFVMLVLTTFALAANIIMGDLMWIEHRDFPGGSFVYYTAKSSLWVNVFGTASCIIGNFMNDALLLYRCYIVWGGNWHVVVVPFIIYLVTIAMSLISLTESAIPNSNFFLQNTVNFIMPWLSLTCGLNVIVTLLISGRILYFARRIATLAKTSAIRHNVYTGIVAILVESALPFTFLGILCAVYFAKQEAPAFAFAIVWGGFVSLSPQMIIMRVAMGRAWSKETSSILALSSDPSPINFAAGGTNSEGQDVCGGPGSTSPENEGSLESV